MFALGDVNTGTNPLTDTAVFFTYRETTCQKVPINSVIPSHAVFDLIDAFCDQSLIPYQQSVLKVIRMKGFRPPCTFALFIGLATKFSQCRYILHNLSVSISNPSNLTCHLNIRPIAYLARAQRFFRLLAFHCITNGPCQQTTTDFPLNQIILCPKPYCLDCQFGIV